MNRNSPTKRVLDWIDDTIAPPALLAVLIAAIAMVACCSASAQDQRHGDPMLLAGDHKPVNALRVVNLTDHARYDVITTVLPWSDASDYRGGPLVADGAPVEVHQLGATWPDGSWRYARVLLPVHLAAQESRVVQVSPAHAGVDGFRWSPAVLSASGRLAVGLRVGGGPTAWTGSWEAIEAGPLALTYRSRVRVAGGPFWLEATVRFLSGAEHARLWVEWGASSVGPGGLTDPGWDPLPKVELLVAGADVALRDPGVSAISSPSPGTWLVDAGGKWAQGQAHALTGELLFAGAKDAETVAAEQAFPVLACATTWAQSGAWGCWGDVPAGAPTTEQEARNAATADWNAWQGADPWEGILHGCRPYPGSTGAQSDFGAVVMLDVARGWPHRLYSIQRSVYGELRRPTHLRWADASPVEMSKDPTILLWGGVLHWVAQNNMLGLTRVPASWDVRVATQFAAGENWWGHDRQHWSVNYLTLYALATGDPIALEECQHKVELWLGECRVNSISPSLNGMDAARAVGRTLQAGSLLWLVTGRQDLLTRMQGRVDGVVAQWIGGGVSGPVKPLAVNGPDPRHQEGLRPFWLPWQEAIGIRGLEACYRTIGYQPAHDIAAQTLASFLQFGIWDDPSLGGWQYGDDVSWKRGGVPLTPAEIAAGWRTAYQPYRSWMAPAFALTPELLTDPTLLQMASTALAQAGAPVEWTAVGTQGVAK